MSIRFVNPTNVHSPCIRAIDGLRSMGSDHSLFHGGSVPRVSAQHEQEVRERIVRAATRVFSERGFHRATMQDIVRASGLSVGAIYTYFKSKDELILAGCDLITDQEMTELARRIAPVDSFRERIAIAVGFVFDQIELESWQLGSTRLLALAWAEADTSPAIREMLLRRRREIHGVAVGLIQEGIARGEFPAWLEIDRTAAALGALIDGVVLQSIEEGAGYRRSEAERRVLGMIEVLMAAAATPAAQRLQAAPPRTLADREERVAS
jgi:AcrR family transcriptional regulator